MEDYGLLYMGKSMMFMTSSPRHPVAERSSWNMQVCSSEISRLIESMMGLRQRQGNLRLVFRLFSLMRGLPSIRLKQSENEPGISLSRPQPHH